MTFELDAAADVPGNLDLPEPSPDEAATAIEVTDGVSALGSDHTLQAETAADREFGDLDEAVDPAPAATPVAEDDGADLLDETTDQDRPGKQATGVEQARDAVRAALDEPGDTDLADGGEGGRDHPNPPTGGSGGNGGNGESGEHDDDAESGDEGEEHGTGSDDRDRREGTPVTRDAEEEPGAGDSLSIPVQQPEEEPALDELRRQSGGASREGVADPADEDEAIRMRDEVHAANLGDLVSLTKLSRVDISTGGGRFDNLHFELTHNHQDASEYLAELAGELRSGSTDLPRIVDWRDEVTEPDKLQAGQVIEVATLKDLDELLSRVGGWLNNDIRAERDSGALDEPHTGIWQDPRHRPSQLLGNVKDLRGRHFFGAQTNIEAMALPTMRGHAEHTRYFTVSSQLKSTGKPPEPSRPMRLVSVSALPAGYKGDKIVSRYTEIGRVPASVAAWLIDSRSRDIGHDTQYDNMQHPILSGKFNRR